MIVNYFCINLFLSNCCLLSNLWSQRFEPLDLLTEEHEDTCLVVMSNFETGHNRDFKLYKYLYRLINKQIFS